MNKVQFLALINDDLQFISALPIVSLVELFQDLRDDPDVDIPDKLPYRDCMFYKLNSPVSASALQLNYDTGRGNSKDISGQIKQACLVQSNRSHVDPRWTRVNQLAKVLSSDYVCLVIDFPTSFEKSNMEEDKDNGFQDEDDWSEDEHDWSEDEDDLGVFRAEDIQQVLRQMNYKIDYIPCGQPRLAVIENKSGDKHRYLKFVELKQESEVKVLQHLLQFQSLSNHTISGVQFWPVRGGTVISMPVAGGWLTELKKPSKKLWSVAVQLFEAIAFMHEHNVAHMDIKPQNVIIPAEGGRLSIIDFSVSIHVRGPNTMYKGVAGTQGYMAPEVRKGKFKPLLADLWSCGRTLEELCWCCDASADRRRLLKIARDLTKTNPEARPTMSTVLQWMASARQGEGNIVSSTLRFLPTVSLLCA